MSFPFQITSELGEVEIKTKKGWFKIAVLLLIFILALLLSTPKAFGLKFSFAYLIAAFIFLFVAEFLWTLIWLIYSGRILITRRDKVSILFAVKVEEESKVIYRELLKSFRREVKNANLNNLFEIKILEDIEFTQEKAEKYVVEERVNLLIWGDTEELSFKGEPVTDLHLNFTYWYKASPSRRPAFRRVIDEGIRNRAWDIFHLNKLPTLRIVSENLSESSIFIIAGCLVSFGFLKIAFDLLSLLHKKIEGITNKSVFPNYSNFKRMIKNHLLQLGYLLCFAFLKKDNFSEAKKYGLESLRFNSSFFPALLNLALVFWRSGDRIKAEEFSRKAYKADPSNTLNRFNKAFFFMLQGKYKKAAVQYKKISAIPSGTNILDIIDFLESEFKRRTDEPGLLFAAGYLNCEFADKKRGRQQLSKFLELARAETKYAPLVNLARPLLSAL